MIDFQFFQVAGFALAGGAFVTLCINFISWLVRTIIS